MEHLLASDYRVIYLVISDYSYWFRKQPKLIIFSDY